MPNMYDIAHELSRALKESNEFKNLKALYEQVEQDPSAKRMLDNFQEMQFGLQQKQMQGQEITQEEAEKAQQLFELVQQHETIMKLMEAEQHLSVAINDINRIFTEPLQELYNQPE